ncbi:ATP-binding protein [Bombella intestini]|uniref:hypothetical protein n=1 Tax=Bombella intestini TaxID=1539051 RepID=UPI000985E3B0|nr:hypothetical protein [Bombella intestini]
MAGDGIWRRAGYGVASLIMLSGGSVAGGSSWLLCGTALAEQTTSGASPFMDAAAVNHPPPKPVADHKRAPVSAHHNRPHVMQKQAQPNKPDSSSLHVQDHVKPGDPLLQGVPSGWGAHVLGVGAAQGGAVAKKQDPAAPADHKDQSLNQFLEEAGREQASAAGPRGTESSHVSQTVSNEPAASVSSRNRVLLPVPEQMGIAAYQSGDRFIILVDARQPMDVSALHGDGIFSRLGVTTLPDLTMISLPVPDTRQLYLSQQSDGWVLGDQPPPGMDYTDRPEITPQPRGNGLLFPMRRPGRVFSIKDPASGTPLVVGTTALDDGGLLSLRKGKDYDVWPSLEGVVIAQHEPPQVVMRAIMQGDLLQRADDRPLADMDRAVYASDVDLNWLGLKHLTASQAQERYRQALVAAADSSPKDRFRKRLEAAQAALGVGAFPDARAIMDVALEDDPEEAFRPDIRFFLAATDLLTGQMNAAAQLVQEWPEQAMRATKLWQGLYEALSGEKASDATRLLARDMPRLLNYPEPLRSSLLPVAAELIARRGTPEEREALNHLPEDSKFRFIQAVRALRDGDEKKATSLLEALSVDHDPVIAEKAMEEGVALSFRDGHLSAEKAARQYASLLPDARLSGRDGIVNMLRAGADIRAHQWEPAIQALDQARQAPPPHDEARMQALLSAALSGVVQGLSEPAGAGHKVTPQDEATLLHEAALLRAHMPDLPASAKKGDLLLAYGKLLGRLGLDEQAGDAMSTAIPMMKNPQDKAAAGDALAENEIRRGLFDKASDILASTGNTSLPAQETARRTRLMASMAAASGKPEVALYLLGADQDPQAADMRVHIHENREEWSPAITDLRSMAEQLLPPQGELTVDQQLLALRFASDASRAGDAGALEWIRNRVGDRPFEGDAGRMFRLLVSVQQAP